MKNKKKYVVSSTVFNSKAEMENQIQLWIDLGTYNEESIVYEIDDDTPQYMGDIKLKKLK